MKTYGDVGQDDVASLSSLSRSLACLLAEGFRVAPSLSLALSPSPRAHTRGWRVSPALGGVPSESSISPPQHGKGIPSKLVKPTRQGGQGAQGVRGSRAPDYSGQPGMAPTRDSHTLRRD